MARSIISTSILCFPEMNVNGAIIYSDPVMAEAGATREVTGLSVIPSPFRDNVRIRYWVPKRDGYNALPVTLEKFEDSGRLVRVLVDEVQSPRTYVV